MVTCVAADGITLGTGGARVGTVGKALDLLERFTSVTVQLGLSEIAPQSGVNKATCYRLLQEFALHSLVEQVGPDREYRLGTALLRLAALREAAVPLREAALPILRHLAEATGETARLSHLGARRQVTLAHAYATQPGIKMMMDDALVLPLHATASGAAVLDAGPDPMLQLAAAPRMTPAQHATILTALPRAAVDLTALSDGRIPDAISRLWLAAPSERTRS